LTIIKGCGERLFEEIGTIKSPLCQDRCRLSLRDFVCEGGIMVGGATIRWCLPGRSPEGDWTVDTSGRGQTPPPTIEATNSDAIFRGI
jgi:hypothetical protein